MHINVHEASDNTVRAAISGDGCGGTAPLKLECLRHYWHRQHAAGKTHCVIDLRYCRRIDSNMMAILTSLVRDGDGEGPAAVELRNVRPHIRQMLEQRGMARLFSFTADAPEPVEAPPPARRPFTIAPAVRQFFGRTVDLFRAEL